MDALTAEFVAESRAGLLVVERCLQRPGDGAAGEMLRALHSMKGAAGFLGFEGIERLADAGESLLERVRDAGLVVTARVAGCLRELMAELRGLLARVEQGLLVGRWREEENQAGGVVVELERLAGDVARRCGKRVRMEWVGVDAQALDGMKDALAHAVRNAVDHGIERPEVRLAAGKPVEGLLRVSCSEDAGWMTVELRDDGAGVAVEEVRGRAVERGVLAVARAGALTRREVVDLVFVPGLSTACGVSGISGRGLGLDVVRAFAEGAGGAAEIETAAGVGTVLRMRVPAPVECGVDAVPV